MSKRAASQASTTPKHAKRRKAKQIEDFFLSTPKKNTGSSTSNSSTSKLANHSSSKQAAGMNHNPTRTITVEVIDVDALDDDSSSASRSTQQQASTSPKNPSHLSSPASKLSWDLSNASVGLHQYPMLAVAPETFATTSLWTPGSPCPYSFLAHALSALTETRSRIAITNILVNTFREILALHPASLLPAIYLLANTLSPSYIGIELGLGGSIISSAIQSVSGLSSASVKRLYTLHGDIGDVAMEAKLNVRTLVPHPPLTVPGVYDTLMRISQSKGQGATKQKQRLVEKLLLACKGEETRFIVRTLTLNLRVGAVRTTILSALSRSMVFSSAKMNDIKESLHATKEILDLIPLPAEADKKIAEDCRDALQKLYRNSEALLKRVFVQHPNFDDIVDALLMGGLDNLAARVPLTVGIPLHPCLGSPTRSLDEIYGHLRDMPFSAEYKYDGQRAQIHAWKQEDTVLVRIFSRHLEDMTSKYPDVTVLMEKMIIANGLQSCIIDSEIVAIDPSAKGKLKTFQELSNRARKDVQLHEIKIPVGVFSFDMMYLDGNSLLDASFRRRRTLLREKLPPMALDDVPQAAQFLHVESCESNQGREEIEEFFLKASEDQCEGLMIKLLDAGVVTEEEGKKGSTRRKPLPATYEPDRRTSTWLKLKQDYVSDADSIDMVPIGAWHGQGRKKDFWSPILLAVRDSPSGQLVAVCKCMSGFTDAFYKSLIERYPPEESNMSAKKPLWTECDFGGYQPEIYFKPSEVWEIRGAELSLSPVSSAAKGQVSPSRGLSLRFPRFIRLRDDKGVEQANDTIYICKLWHSQGGKKEGKDDGELIDVEEDSEFLQSEQDEED